MVSMSSINASSACALFNKNEDLPKTLGLVSLAVAGLSGIIFASLGIGFVVQVGSIGSLNHIYSIVVIAVSELGGIFLLSFAVALAFRFNFIKCSTCNNVSADNQKDQDSISLISSQRLAHNDLSEVVHQQRHPLNTWCPLKSYFDTARDIIKAQSHRWADAGGELIVLEQRYLQRKDVIFFDRHASIFNPPDANDPINFGLTCLIGVGKTTGKNRMPVTALQAHVQGIIKSIQEAALFIPKLFIPVILIPSKGGPVPHAVLLVIEPNANDASEAKITLINPMGSGGSYKDFENSLVAMGHALFPSPTTKSIHNYVPQQTDGWACGWHMLENIELLSKVPDVYQFIRNKSLPPRSSNEIQRIFNQEYRRYAKRALASINP